MPRVSGRKTAKMPAIKANTPNTSSGKKSKINLSNGTNGASSAPNRENVENAPTLPLLMTVGIISAAYFKECDINCEFQGYATANIPE